MYPGKGTVVLIRPAQTFYERIKLGLNLVKNALSDLWVHRIQIQLHNFSLHNPILSSQHNVRRGVQRGRAPLAGALGVSPRISLSPFQERKGDKGGWFGWSRTSPHVIMLTPIYANKC